MALQSSRKGLRKEQVDYLGNIIIDERLKQDIVNSVNDVFASKSDVLTYEEILATTDLTGKIASASSVLTLASNRNNWKPLVDIIESSVIVPIEANFRSGADRTVVTIQTGAGSEAGGIVFKHTITNKAYGILFSRSIEAKIIKRNPDGSWYYREIL